MQSRLQSAGYYVRTAAMIKNALRRIPNDFFTELILTSSYGSRTDLWVTEMNGYQLETDWMRSGV